MELSDLQNTVSSLDPFKLLTEREAADFLGYSVRTLQKWRITGNGPIYVRVSNRSVRYRRKELMDWSEKNLCSSTSDINAN